MDSRLSRDAIRFDPLVSCLFPFLFLLKRPLYLTTGESAKPAPLSAVVNHDSAYEKITSFYVIN